MNIGFTGHRDKTFDEHFLIELAQTYPDATWIHGGAIGFDTQVDKIARANGITVIVIKPDYPTHGKRAPLIRNLEIVDRADRIVAGYDGRKGGGTDFTIAYAKRKSKAVTILKPDARYLLVA